MSLEISPNTVQFESAGLASQVELTLNNKSDNDVKYRFRLQSKCVSISQPKGTMKGGHAKTVLVDYDPALNMTKDILLSMQIKYSEVTGPSCLAGGSIQIQCLDFLHFLNSSSTFGLNFEIKDKDPVIPFCQTFRTFGTCHVAYSDSSGTSRGYISVSIALAPPETI